jgi:hypothetical protein
MVTSDGYVSAEGIQRRILVVRGVRVLLDADIACLYGVETKRLNEQVRRNELRFPSDFVFRLTREEKAEVVANCDHLSKLKYSSHLPYAFTEHGALMAATVLSTERAVAVSVFVVRAFVQLRQFLGESAELRRRMEAVESRLSEHDRELKALLLAVRRILESPRTSKQRQIGFMAEP